MFYAFATYRPGSTNGQSPTSKILVTGIADKAEAKAIALRTSGAYKVLGSKITAMSVDEYVAIVRDIYGDMPVQIVGGE